MSRKAGSQAPLVVTAGDPAGIGPELCLAVAATGEAPAFVVISDADLMAERARSLAPGIRVTTLASSDPFPDRDDDELLVIHQPFAVPAEVRKPEPANAPALVGGLHLAVRLCLENRCRAMVTAPVAKHVITAGGIPFIGHTEFLARETKAPLPLMLLVADELRVALATTHIPLADVPAAIDRQRIGDSLDVLDAGLRQQFGIASPDIVVCGLNPHAGDRGLLGHEDAEIIAPAIAEARARGLQVRGPLPADTAFTPAAGEPDAILAMYHDQGLPVFKYAAFGHGVNVTLGLPIVRTSVDHGTAFDIAGTGRADYGSLLQAMLLADELAAMR